MLTGMCVHLSVCASMYACVCACVWRPQVLSVTFCDCSGRLGRLASEPKGSAGLHLPSARIISMHLQAWIFLNGGSGNGARSSDKHFVHQAISPAHPRIYFCVLSLTFGTVLLINAILLASEEWDVPLSSNNM